MSPECQAIRVVAVGTFHLGGRLVSAGNEKTSSFGLQSACILSEESVSPSFLPLHISFFFEKREILC